MIYSDFINKTTSLLLYDSIEDDEEHSAFIDQHVRTWMTTLQYYVDNFKVKNVNTYKEADVSVVCDGATITLPAELEKLVRVEFIQPSNYPRTIVVASSGTAAANGTYTLMDGSDAETRPTYEKGDYLITWNTTQWELSDGTDVIFFSTDDVVSPDLVTTWELVVPDAMVVEGAGTDLVNALYIARGTVNGKPIYFNSDYGLAWIETKWQFYTTIPYSILYSSLEDVSTPDLVTAWNVESGGTAPAPTVRRAIASDFPELLPVPTVTRGNACDDTIPMVPTSYDERDELLNRDCKYSGCYKYAIDKRAVEISIYPYPREDYTYGPESIKVTWEGLKSNYNGSDEVPFTEDTIANCAAYLNAQLARKKEDKLANYNSFYATYLEGRKEIAMAQRNKSWQRP